jgi:hypothetical protein
MNLRTLLGWGLAATLLAACSGGGGGGSVSPSNGASNNAPITTGALMMINAPVGMGGSSMMHNGRNAQFIGSATTTIGYTFNPGSISGSFTYNAVTHTFDGTATNCTSTYPASPPVYACPVALAPGSYNVTLTLSDGGTPIGSSTATGPITIMAGQQANVPVVINPINAGPALAISGSPTQFYVDGQAGQTVSLQANELDPAGDIITTYYGTVAAGYYKALSFTPSGGQLGITTAPANIPINTPPAGQTGYVGAPEAVVYNGAGVNAQSYGLTLNDGTNTTPLITIPYVSMSNNASNPAANELTFAGLGAPYDQTVTVTETTTAASGGLDANFKASTTCPSADATFTPSVTVAPAAAAVDPTTIAASNATVTFTAQPVAILAGPPGTCTLTVTSVQDANLSQTITIYFPGSSNIQPSSHSRS